MSGIENLTRQVKAGETLKPWIMLGPFNHDVSDKVIGLSYFEAQGTQVGRTVMNGIVDQALGLLAAAPKEGQPGCFLGEETRWTLMRGPEKYLSWGTYNIKNHLGAAFLSTIITPDHAGLQQWRLTVRIRERAIICINGVVVFDSANVSEDFGYAGYVHEFQAPLRAGENIVNVGLFRLARMAQVGMRLEITDGDVTTCVPLAPGIPLAARAKVEQELAGLRLARDVFYPEHDVSVELGHAPDSGFQLRVECGREADWKSFDAFVNALTAARISARGGIVTFDSPSVGCFVTGWDVKPTVNGASIELSRYPLVDSAWAHSDFGSGEMVLKYGDEIYELWLNQ